jgi:CheY-like chemotaxis protein
MAGKKILIVDDEPMFRTLMIQCLRPLVKEDVEFLTAEDGFIALKMADSEEPDLVFLDLMMPGMDGIEVCRLIKTNDRLKHIQVVILTARKHPQDREIGKLSGADKYLVKPFEPKDILHCAQEALGLLPASA